MLEVTSPRDKLETLFLRIVEQAQAERLSTGGAVSGEVAEFLRAEPSAGPDGRAVIEGLVSVAQEPSPAAEPPVEAPAAIPAVRKDLLEQLTRGAQDAPAAQAPAPGPKAKPAEQADRAIIESLLGGATDENDKTK